MTYQILGTSVPTMLGRKRLLDQLERHLLKPSPDHVQVVGPTLFGKSVLLSHLAARHRSGSSHYVGAAYLDLRHAPPLTDADFRKRFAELLKHALHQTAPHLAEFIEPANEGVHELLVFVADELEKEKQRVLLVLDGFDHVLAGTGLTRNLWDQLRALAQKASVRLVTGSRHPLRELCMTEDSQTSDFWEIFYDTPINVGAFEESDWNDLVIPLEQAGVAVDGSGRKEFVNWSGGVPVLAIALLERVAQLLKPGSNCSKNEVDTAAASTLAERRQILSQLWEDCDLDTRSDVAMLASRESDGLPASEFSDGRQRALEQHGLATILGNRMRPSCRLMARFGLQQAPAVADLRRLFGTAEVFDANIRSLLEHRLAQVLTSKTDATLRGFLQSAVRDLEPDPELSLKWVRSIASRSLALIWDAELGRDQKLPDAWVNEWKQGGEKLQWLDIGQRLPRRQGAQCNVLRLATGADNIRPMAKHVTKPTALLLDALQSIGDFAQHRDDFPESRVSKCFAGAIILTALELVDSLNRDLARRPAGS